MQWTLLTLLLEALWKIPLILKGLNVLNLLSNNVNVSKVFLQIYSYDFSKFISQYVQVVNIVQKSYFHETNAPIKGNFG